MSIAVGMPLSEICGNNIEICGAGISSRVMGMMGYEVALNPGDGGAATPAPQPNAAKNFMNDFKPV